MQNCFDEISSLARSVKGNPPLAERIRKKYKMKNTTGYSINALTDFSDPFDIIEHLMIGSEGTFGFISEVTSENSNRIPLQGKFPYGFS